jgi:hypothetical protein
MSERHRGGCTGTLHSLFGHLHAPAALFTTKAKFYTLNWRLGWPHSWPGRCGKIEKLLVPAGNSTTIVQSTIGWLLDKRKICHVLHRPPHLQKSLAKSGAVIKSFAENIEFYEDILQKLLTPSDALNNC